MSAELDLDDVAATSPLAQKELAALRTENEALSHIASHAMVKADEVNVKLRARLRTAEDLLRMVRDHYIGLVHSAESDSGMTRRISEWLRNDMDPNKIKSEMTETEFQKAYYNEWNIPEYPDGVPCSHPGCLSHVSHPCEGCGRIAGRIAGRSRK